MTDERMSMVDQKLSVAMCVYGKDNPEWFKTAVDSLLNQTFKPHEIVLVVDGPVPDRLNQAISAYEASPNFKVIRLEKNQGHGNARMCSLNHCTHEIVALMDADDICVPTRFEQQITALENNPKLDIIGGNIAEFIDDPQNPIGERRVPESDSEIKRYLKKRCPMNQMTVMFRKQSAVSVGGYLDWYCDEDYYLWVRMYLANMVFANIPKVLVNVRVGKDTYRRRGGWKYFKSEIKLQKYMWKNRVIGFPTYLMNCAERFVVQILAPNYLRGWLFKKFARSKAR